MVKFVEQTPTNVVRTDEGRGPSAGLEPQDVEQIAEIFQTPLTGSYVWNYTEADKKLQKLYRLGKERNWDAALDVDWANAVAKRDAPIIESSENPYDTWAPFVALNDEQRTAFGWHCQT